MEHEKFIEEMMEYINAVILPNNKDVESVIYEPDTMTPRGHRITYAFVRKETDADMRPVFYAEEIFADAMRRNWNPKKAAEHLDDYAKRIWADIRLKQVPAIIDLKTADMQTKTNIAILPIPIKMYDASQSISDIAVREHKDVGLYEIIKAPFQMPNQSDNFLYVPVKKENITDEAWKVARMNSLHRSKIVCMDADMPIEDEDGNKVVIPFLQCVDLNEFYNYFYLIEKDLYRQMSKDGVKKIYIIPASQNTALLLLVPEEYADVDNAHQQLLSAMAKHMPLDIVIYTAETDEFTIFDPNV